MTNIEPTVSSHKDHEMSFSDTMFFRYSHLPPHLQEVSKIFSEAASQVVATCKNGNQRQLCLQLLLQAKDAAVRSKLVEGG